MRGLMNLFSKISGLSSQHHHSNNKRKRLAKNIRFEQLEARNLMAINVAVVSVWQAPVDYPEWDDPGMTYEQYMMARQAAERDSLKHLQLNLQITGDDLENAGPLTIELRPEVNGRLLDTVFQEIVINDPESYEFGGGHIFKVEYAVSDLDIDYKLVAVFDADNAIAETNETDNMVGISRLFLDDSSGTLYMYGTDADEGPFQPDSFVIESFLNPGADQILRNGDDFQEYLIQWSAGANSMLGNYTNGPTFLASEVDRLHARLQKGDDFFSAWAQSVYEVSGRAGLMHFDKPILVFGGKGADSISGGLAEDAIYGGPGVDITIDRQENLGIRTNEGVLGWYAYPDPYPYITNYYTPVQDTIYITEEERDFVDPGNPPSDPSNGPNLLKDLSDIVILTYDVGEEQVYTNDGVSDENIVLTGKQAWSFCENDFVDFDASFTLSPGATITMVVNEDGSVTITKSGTGNAILTDVSHLCVAVTFINEQGTTTIATALGDATKNYWDIEVHTAPSGTSKVIFDNPAYNHTVGVTTYTLYNQKIKSLTIEAGAVAEVKNKKSAGTLSGSLFVGTTTVATPLSIAGPSGLINGGILDLNNNDLITNSTSGAMSTNQTSIRTYIANGFGVTGYSTSGAKIISNSLTTGLTLGMFNNAAAYAYTNFDGFALSGTSQIIVKYTTYGDADIDGDTDLNDLGLWSAYYTGDLMNPTSPTTYWYQGDFDHDGDTDINDIGLWSSAHTGDLNNTGSLGWLQNAH